MTSSQPPSTKAADSRNANSNQQLGHVAQNASSSWLGFWKSPVSPPSTNTTTQADRDKITDTSSQEQLQMDSESQGNTLSEEHEKKSYLSESEDSEHTSNGTSSQGIWNWLGYTLVAADTIPPSPSPSLQQQQQEQQQQQQSQEQEQQQNLPIKNNEIAKHENTSDQDNKLPVSSSSSSLSSPSSSKSSAPSYDRNKESTSSLSKSNKSSWRSYFFYNNTNDTNDTSNTDGIDTGESRQTSSTSEKLSPSDSVIVEPSTSTQDDLLKKTPVSVPSKKKTPTTVTATKNVVLPTIHSQFTETPPPAATLFTKAIHAINAIFTQQPSSHHHDRHIVPDLIRQMKAHPDTVAGKKFVIIGVHGWFPTKLVRSVVGEPTGTSSKFCEQTAKALEHYFQIEHDLSLPLNCMTLIPLQWEGKVQDRVDKLYSFLTDNPATLEAVQSADAIFWTTHSQGTPVSAMLLDRLIQNEIIHLKRQPICLLAMAGIAHGPFASLKGNVIVKYFEADAARELFDFMDPSSDITQLFQASMASILRQGVKTVLVGSMQDQVVPLYSAIMVATEHPNILRAIYIDGHIYSPDDFLINLIAFALRLRNAGLSDHGLLLHISDVLAGNIYAWEGGHSTIYEETSVFELAPRYLFDTYPLGRLLPNHQENVVITHMTKTAAMVEAKLASFQAKVRLNPYYLTWAMRGIFDDSRILQVFGDELERLRTLFDHWHPTSAKLREIKFRLEPIKARL